MASSPDWLTVDEALLQIIADVAPLPGELCSLRSAAGRTLAGDVAARIANPPSAVSAMDGYTLRATDAQSPGAVLSVIGEAAAGDMFDGHCGPGEAVRIFTGALIPDGADCVVPQEETRANDNGTVTFTGVGKPGEYIRPAGADFQAATPILKTGRTLDARALLVAATAGINSVTVRRQPRVAVLATGDELVPVGQVCGPGQIMSSSPLALSAMLTGWGATCIDLGIARDDMPDLTGKLSAAADCDVIVTIGGASVGARDLVREALLEAGYDIQFWRIAMRPGKPLFLASRGDQRVVGLPGNPVSALICARAFLMPLVMALLGCKASNEQIDCDIDQTSEARILSLYWPLHHGHLAADVPANGPRLHFMRATGEYDNKAGHFKLLPVASQDSGRTHLLSKADAVILREPHAPALSLSSPVRYFPLDF